MQIIIDDEHDSQGNTIGHHVLTTDRLPGNVVGHPTLPGQFMDVIDFLAWLQINRATLLTAGFNIPVKLKNVAPGTTRWNVLVAAVNSPTATAAERALGLT